MKKTLIILQLLVLSCLAAILSSCKSSTGMNPSDDVISWLKNDTKEQAEMQDNAEDSRVQSLLTSTDTSIDQNRHLEYRAEPLVHGIKLATALCLTDRGTILAGLSETGSCLVWMDLQGNTVSAALPDEIDYIYAICENHEDFIVLGGSMPAAYRDQDGNAVIQEHAAGELMILLFDQKLTLKAQMPLTNEYGSMRDIFRCMDASETSYFICSEKLLIRINKQTGEELERIYSGPLSFFRGFVRKEGYIYLLKVEALEEAAASLLVLHEDDLTVQSSIQLDGKQICGIGEGKDGQILINDGSPAYGAVTVYDTQTQAMTPLFSWGQLPTSIPAEAVFETEDGYLFFSHNAMELEYVDWADGPKQERIVIELALVCSEDREMAQMVREFNLSQQTYQIRQTVYAEIAQDGALSIENLLVKIASGNAPDLICLMPYGYGASIAPFLERPELMMRELSSELIVECNDTKSEFLPGLISATEQTGMYYLPIGVVVETLAAPESLADHTGITLHELESMRIKAGKEWKTFPSWMDAQNLLSLTMPFYIPQFIDRESGTCSFDAQSCMDWLIWCRTWAGDGSTPAGSEKALLQYAQFASCENILSMGSIAQFWFEEPEYCLVGVPVEDGFGSMWHIALSLGIPIQAANPQGASTFICFCLDWYRNQNLTQCIPSTQNGVQNQIDWLTSGEAIDSFGNPVKASEPYVDQFLTLLEQTTVLADQNITIQEIVADEASMYFAGLCSVQEAAQRIQSRVSLYLMERG